MPAFNRALVLVPLPSSNIILGFVFGHDFLYRQALQTDKQLLVSSQLSPGKGYFKYCHCTKMDTWRIQRRLPSSHTPQSLSSACQQKGPNSRLHPPSFALLQLHKVGRNPAYQAGWGFLQHWGITTWFSTTFSS